jgi:predicted 3-demethylubiquinone-9 3-methyltransferase (glyoxalase superfamily)
MPSITPFLWFDSQAEEAAKLYVSIFKNSKILNIRRRGKKAFSVEYRLCGQDFIALNGGPHFKFTPAISMFVRVKTQREVDEIWNKLLKGGGKPQQCGWLTDKYGLSWQIVPSILGELLADKNKAKSERVWKAMMQMVKLDIKALKAAAKG